MSSPQAAHWAVMDRPTARDRPPEEAAIDTSFARGLRLLLAVADRGEARADELATALEMPVSTVYRYLRTLAAFGFVDRRDGRFLLGPRLLIGSGSVVTTERLRRHAGPILEELVARTGETGLVARRVGLAGVVLAQAQPDKPLRAAFELESQLPLDRGAVGAVLLAYAPAALVEEATQGLEPAIAGDLRRSLRLALAEGSAVSREPDEITLVAAPILMPSGIVGALAVAGPTSRCGAAWTRRARRLLPRAAEQLANAIETDAGADPGP